MMFIDSSLMLCVRDICQVKSVYVNFLSHCYIDTEVEVKEIYTSPSMWNLFENFLVDMGVVSILSLIHI